ncbi:Ubiquitin-like-specific protease 2 [Colletotrichum sp. SAR 10_99]|nr:Ubiquitin-like-specific protease 2 [Colletotrichum sp. SAR 10_96]KAJ5009304.1 Ubiquitin-like-specific protease 2 [Colletotrichum sp. SAR 10_99]
MKKEHRTTPPADHAPSYPKTSPHSCDETAQKYAAPHSLSSTLTSNARSHSLPATGTRLTFPRALEELGREKPAHEAEEEKGSQGGGKTCGKDGVAGSTIRRRAARRNTITAEQLRERYRDPENHSFPAYGNPKDGVPISDPMSAKSNRLKGLLSGSFAPKKTFDPGTGGQNKRPSYSTTTNNEPPRSAKRQKTKDEASSAAAYTNSTFAPPPSPSPARSIRSSSAVDLTKPDLDAASNRSTQQPAFQVEEYRNVQRNNSVPRKNTRTRKRSANKSPTSKVQPLDIDGEEDEISQDMPAVKKRNVGKMVPFKMTPLKGSRDASEGISDSDLHKIDELASEAGSAKKRQVFDVDPISDDEKPSPTTSESRLAKADMSRVEFKKQKPDAVIFKLKRAVSGKHILVVDDLPPEDQPHLQVLDDKKHLVACGRDEFGKHKATVIRDDILRLDEGQFMNDNLIWFYMKSLQVKLEKENKQTHDRIYFMNTYFYPKLTEKSGRGINYEGVRSWTTKVDLFSYDYIVVPVNEQAHWYLAIICHPSKLIKAQEVQEVDKEPPQVAQKEALVSAVGEQVEHMSLDDPATENKDTVVLVEPKASPVKSQLPRKSTGALPRKKDPSEARVITLDSLGVGHSATCGNLKEYLVREAKDKKNLEIEPPGQFGMTAKNIPEQLDHASCGAFLLGYLREFLKAPDDTVGRIVRKEEMNWDITSIAMRSELRSIIIEQREEQNRRFALLAAEKKAKRKTPKAPISSKSSEEPSGVPSTPRTPVSAGDAPKKPSSTIKGSPAIPSIPSMDGSGCPVKMETNGEAPPLHDSVPQEPSGSEVGIAKTPEELQPVASKISERPKTPPRSEPPAKVNSSPTQQRTSPRFNKGKTNGQVDKMQTTDEAPATSPSATSKAGSAQKRLRKPGFSPAEEIMNQISSPSKTHPMPIRTERRASRPTDKSPTPTQQLLSESQDSPSKKTPVQNLTHTAERPSTHKDRSTPKQKDLQTLMQAPTLTSPYFAPPVKSPPSATKPRQLSIEEIPQPISTQPIPSIEDEGLYHKSPGNNGFKSSQTVTVDLTD